MSCNFNCSINASSNENSCIGWFKLAELISRKEKEKALSLYRLLSHSFEDKAYALQLEGDILWSLEDNGALKKYEQAAYLYKKEKKITATAAIYEHLLVLQSQNPVYMKTLALLYILLSWPEKFEYTYKKLHDLFVIQKTLSDEILNFTKKIITLGVEGGDFDKKQFLQGYDIELTNLKQNSWISSSLFRILSEKKSDLLEPLQLYCLENNLNFDS